MLLSLRQIKTRIRGIENVNKITHAMEMVSIAKLRPAQNQLFSSRRYFSKMEGLLENLLANHDGIIHPLMEKRHDTNKTALCLITSDTGLCGSYNNNIIRTAEDFINKTGKEKTVLVCIGKKGLNYFKKKGMNIAQAYTDSSGRYSQELADKILKTLTDIFLAGQVSEVYVAYTHFQTASRHKAVTEKFLNIDLPKQEEKIKYILEPGINAILNELILAYIFNKIKLMVMNAFASEHSARAIAMGESTENAKDLLQDLTLLRNKVRQANITKEILEIVSSAEVLR